MLTSLFNKRTLPVWLVPMALAAGVGGHGTSRSQSEPLARPPLAPAVVTVAAAGGDAKALRQTPPTGLGSGAAASFDALQRQLRGDGPISVAVQPLGVGPLTILGGDPAMLGMSTTKVLILAALLRDRGGVARLTASQRALAGAAITESDNQSILELFSALEHDRGGLIGASNYATELLRDAGDPHTTVATAPPPAGYVTTFGQTKWSPTAEVRFFRVLALGCLLPPADTAFILGLMRRIEASESWGIGSAGFAQVAFKGGWGPLADGYGVRQTAIVGSASRAVVVALTVDPAPSFSVGTTALTAVARWLHNAVRLTPRARPSCAHARQS
jgi:hypothetical protein